MDPWHIRRATASHYQKHKNLVALHGMTLAWLTEGKSSRAAHTLSRGMSAETTENLWMLDKIAALDSLLDDTSPDDLLARLDRTVNAVQAWTLRGLYEKSTASDRDAVRNQLEQASWRAGRDCAAERWKALADSSRKDIRALLLCLEDSPLGGSLLVRATRSEVSTELLHCPHRTVFSEVREMADALCPLQFHWIKGYVHSLNGGVILDHTPAGSEHERCRMRWREPA